jgi:predicted TIM-barrel fold metal-dependent hydrolase
VSIIDAAVHPVPPEPGELNRYIGRPYRAQQLTAPEGGPYSVPIDPHRDGAAPPDGGAPGSNVELLRHHTLDEADADYAILLPMTRGHMSDPRLEAAIAAGTNEWLADRWLGSANGDGRLKGTIRVSPRRPHDAIKEIERWSEHGHFVQVAVPLETHVLYGDSVYFEIWKAAAERALPVAIHADRAAGALGAPTAGGFPRYFLEEYSQQPIYSVIHLCSLIANGVFDRLPGLVFVFADGGFDFMQTLMWRMDKEWRSSRAEAPWVQKSPTLYLDDHVRFVVHRGDGLEDSEQYARFIELNNLAPVLMYGSNYPSWDYLDARTLAGSLPSDLGDQIMSANARRTYRLPAAM